MKEIKKGVSFKNPRSKLTRLVTKVVGDKVAWKSGKKSGACSVSSMKRWIDGMDNAGR
jgi:hypothetical protein